MNRRPLYAIGFSGWKKPIVRDFLPGREVKFVSTADAVPPGADIAVWGMQEPTRRTGREGQVLRLEDGFLRSVGLGADLIRPLSWVIDPVGIYYDATQPSALELLLQNADIDDAMQARAAALRMRIVAAGLTKYNVGNGEWQRPATDRRVILVPGQVESDASLAYGAPGLRRNIELLQAVRQAHPDAYIVYKPHPDVVARLRKEGDGENGAAACCDEVVVDQPMNRLLDAVDEVHVLTSLAGFEALLRGRRVETYGQPFYAGWGLTTDHCPLPRRTRRRTLDELAAAALILYPTYVSHAGGAPGTPETALEELLAWRTAVGGRPGVWQKLKRVALRWIVGVR
jgi:capsular polysaccharide export protein